MVVAVDDFEAIFEFQFEGDRVWLGREPACFCPEEVLCD